MGKNGRRNGQILSMRKAGYSLQAVGDYFGCSRQRIYQILTDPGPGVRPKVKRKKRVQPVRLNTKSCIQQWPPFTALARGASPSRLVKMIYRCIINLHYTLV